MSESIRKLNENPVTALADTDYIVACDASGALSPISFANFKADALYNLLKAEGRNLIIWSDRTISHGDNNADGTFSFAKDSDSFIKFKSSIDLTSLIGKIFTFSFECEGLQPGDLWKFGIGIQSYANTQIHNGKNSITFVGTSLTCSPKGGDILFDDTSREVASIPSVKFSKFKLECGEVATAYFPAFEDLKPNWGGVISSPSITCTQQEKGGRHERTDKGAYQRVSEVYYDGYRIRKGLVPRHKHGNGSRRVFCDISMRKSSYGGLRLWNLGSVQRRQLLLSALRDGSVDYKWRVSDNPSDLLQGIFKEYLLQVGSCIFGNVDLTIRKEAVAA